MESKNATFDYDKRSSTFTMTLLNDLSDMSGKVKVVAQNIGGKDSCEANLTVKGNTSVLSMTEKHRNRYTLMHIL